MLMMLEVQTLTHKTFDLIVRNKQVQMNSPADVHKLQTRNVFQTFKMQISKHLLLVSAC